MTDPVTRTAYDAVAALYADTFRDVLDALPLGRALITASWPRAGTSCSPSRHATATYRGPSITRSPSPTAGRPTGSPPCSATPA
ncbi:MULTISPECIES: hypothetical protein [unclassified Spirillospora]|uniref:hypothetical protein n=1 Tax=unclassified Spirillospora TaxID=2642701 RepID=UPI003714B359